MLFDGSDPHLTRRCSGAEPAAARRGEERQAEIYPREEAVMGRRARPLLLTKLRNTRPSVAHCRPNLFKQQNSYSLFGHYYMDKRGNSRASTCAETRLLGRVVFIIHKTNPNVSAPPGSGRRGVRGPAGRPGQAAPRPPSPSTRRSGWPRFVVRFLNVLSDLVECCLY